jgi:GT2 family glycosyltransferase/glycosyltransferase involved in cell wall biosynthesis
MLDVIIVNYNSTDLLRNCLQSVEKSLNGYRARIYVQDNASTDNVEEILPRFPSVNLKANTANLGFARAVNQALVEGDGDYIVLLNPDTFVVGDFFDACVDYMESQTDVGIVGPRIYDSDGRLQNSARSFPTPLTALFGRSSMLSRWFPRNPITSRNLLSLKSDGWTPMPVDWVSGACMMVRRKAVEDVGILDERFFMYWEDADWCWRMWERGWKVVYFPRASVYHYVGGSSNKLPIRSRFEFHKSVYHLFNKHNYRILSLAGPLALGVLGIRFFLMALPHVIRHLSTRMSLKGLAQSERLGIAESLKKGQIPGLHLTPKCAQEPVVPPQRKPVRVLQIITRLILGGAQETAILTAELLDPRDWRVDLLTGPQTGPEGSLFEAAHQKGIPLTIEPLLVREVNPIKDLIATVRMIRFIRHGRYTVVHTNSSKAGILGRWSAWFAGTPLILHTVHGWGFHSHQNPVERFFYINLEKITLPITHHLIAVTQRDIEKGVQSGIGCRDDYVVIRSGIELDRFGHPDRPPHETREALGIPPTAQVVGTVTRLSRQKAPLDLIRAVEIVARKVPTAVFVIVGDGPLRGQVERMVRRMGLTDRVILTGLRRDVPDLMAIFDIFLLPSLWEGLPRVIPQAMAHGLPIVASAVDGNLEAVRHGETGFLIPPADYQQAAAAVIELLSRPQDAARMGAVGRRHVAEFDARRMVAQMADLYWCLIQPDDRPRARP